MQEAQATLEVSERRACQVIGQPRSTQRYAVKERDGERPLVVRMTGPGSASSALRRPSGVGVAAKRGVSDERQTLYRL